MQSHWSLYLMAFFYFMAGISHFLAPKIYAQVLPRSLPAPLILIFVSGLIEIVLALGVLWDATRLLSLILIILMLIIYLPIHVYALANNKPAFVPRWVHIIRIPMQFALIFWAYIYIW